MNESAARAERFHIQSASPTYLWNVTDKPLSVQLSLELIGRLEHEVVEAFRSVTSRGSEIGGLLLGRVVADARPIILVEEFERIECDYTRGPLFRLNDNDRERFRAAVEQNAQNTGSPAVVGFFRSNTRKGLSLDPEDIAFFNEQFRDPLNIALLVRPFATRTCVGGIFLRENGSVNGDASPLEFPFALAELAGRAVPAPATPETTGLAPAMPADAAPAAPANKQPARAQIVPIASRRETLPSAPEAELPEPVAQTVAESKPEPVVEPVAEVRKPEPPPAAPAEPKPPRVEVSTPFSAAEIEPEATGSRLKLWIGMAVAAVLVVVSLVFVPGLFKPSGAPAVPGGSQLALRIEHTGTDLMLTWNRDAEAVRNASRAVLQVNDGEQHENVEMDLSQLRNGSIVYSPATSDVSFRMEVFGQAAGKSVTESVRVLKTKPSAIPADGASAKSTPKPADIPAAQGANGTPAEPVAEPTTPAPSKPAPKPFNAPPSESLSARLRPTRPNEMPEPPAEDAPAINQGGSSALPSGILGAPSAPSPVAASKPAVPQAPAPGAAKPAAQNTRVGGKVSPVELVSRREPQYPPLARQAGVWGEVVVEALIDARGKVAETKVISGHPLLREAALQSVRFWVYRPATLNGEPVESRTQVRVNFLKTR